jgi:hypothetical protein
VIIMGKQFRRTAALVGLGIAVSAAALPATAKELAGAAETPIQTATKVEQRVLNDVVRAESALSHSRRHAAIAQIEKAEVTLLNADGAGEYKAPEALAALTKAHEAVLRKDMPGATSALKTAEAGLRTPQAS